MKNTSLLGLFTADFEIVRDPNDITPIDSIKSRAYGKDWKKLKTELEGWEVLIKRCNKRDAHIRAKVCCFGIRQKEQEADVEEAGVEVVDIEEAGVEEVGAEEAGVEEVDAEEADVEEADVEEVVDTTLTRKDPQNRKIQIVQTLSRRLEFLIENDLNDGEQNKIIV